MANPVTESQNATRLVATTTIHVGPGGMLGIFVASASATPVISVVDGTNIMVNAFTPVPATFYPIPGRFSTSLIVQIGGTIDCTVFWSP